MKKIIPFILCTLFIVPIFAQTFTLEKTLNWDESPIIHNPTGNFPTEIWSFQGAHYKATNPSLPYYSERFAVPAMGDLSVTVASAQYEPFQKTASPDDAILSENLEFDASVYQNRQEYLGEVSFVPIRKTANGSYERLVSFRLRVRFNANIQAAPRDDYTYTSVLSDGSIYKIAVEQAGIHQLSYEFLKNDLGMDIDNIDPRKIQLFGNGGGPLPELVSADRHDDLQENAIQIVGENDGSFDAGDFILFYAEGPKGRSLNETTRFFSEVNNIYDTRNYYFIKVGTDNGQRVGDSNHQISSLSNTQYSSSTYDYFVRFEEDKYNLLAESSSSQGSGQNWYGDIFNPTRDRSYSFDIPSLATSQPVNMKVKFGARSGGTTSYTVQAGGQSFNASISGVNLGNPEGTYANDRVQEVSFSTSQPNFDVSISYPAVGDGTNTGWLDYIEINAKRNLQHANVPLIFQDAGMLDYLSSSFQLSGAGPSTMVWDISSPIQAKLITGASVAGGTLTFGVPNNNKVGTFVAFNAEDTFLTAEAVGPVANQNYHGIDQIDMIIVHHNEFKAAAQRLASHRSSHSGLTIQLVDIDKLYNEFSSGRKDASAIRDFAKMLFSRSGQFKYLLLFGDGSFDSRNIYGNGKDFIPAYETPESANPIKAFPSDDYYALITDDDGSSLNGALDIAVGRIPARTAQEAEGVVDKIIRYDTELSTLGDWRNRVTYVADDGDDNLHINDGDVIAEATRSRHKVFNYDKIYFDAYQQISTSGDARYPDAQEGLNRTMFKGVLVINYMGHGGGRGWAQERVLTNNDIANWTNADRLPLFVTATCSFAGYDEASFTSAGEQVMLKPDGGAIALFTTTRAVFTSGNRELTREVFDTVFNVVNGYASPIGEILRFAKNNYSLTSENSRKFTLLGDPSLRLAIPELDVVTTKINGNEVGTVMDTIRALQEVTIEGMVLDLNGDLNTSFNGTVYPTIYDKEVTVNTLGQDEDSQVKSFKLQKNILFKGRATVNNGKFSFTFIVPKDINYEYGLGKISYYAENGTQVDARGFYDGITIGGTDPNGIQDDEGPLVEVFMNNEDFVLGGLTDADPTLLVKLSDDHGINVAGTSIGHDLTGILDQNTQNTYILNDFYEAELDDHTKGQVRFPLYNIEEGQHTITVKAWDVANNSAEGFTEFVVASGADAALDHVLNYPNPFTTCTNFQFEHNMAGQLLDVQVQIFTVSGKLAKTIHTQINADGYRVTDIKWDGTDDYGDRLGRGVYIYKVKVRSLNDPSASLKGESDFEKLVILK